MHTPLRSVIALAAVAVCSYPVFLAGQGAAVQRPPRITSGALVKPTVTPGKFRPATLPMSWTPDKPVNESGALFGFHSYDPTEGKLTVRSGEPGQYTGQFVGCKVLVTGTGRPVTFEFEIYRAKKTDEKIRLQLGERVRKPDGTFESKVLNMTTVEVFFQSQRLSISGTPSGEGWVTAMATPVKEGTLFDLISVTVKPG